MDAKPRTSVLGIRHAEEPCAEGTVETQATRLLINQISYEERPQYQVYSHPEQSNVYCSLS